MKKFAYIFALTIASSNMVQSLLLNDRNSIVSLVVVFLVIGTVSFFLVQLLLALPMQKSVDSIVSEINKSDDLIAYTPMNYCKKYFVNAIGGVGCLYKEKLVFVPHKINFSWESFAIMLSDIEYISDYRVLGIFDTGLKITLKSGKTERFAVDRKSDFYREIVSQYKDV